MRTFVFALLLILQSLPAISFAQEDPTENDNVVNYLDPQMIEFGAAMGSLLPFGIRGVEENYPLAGIWFSHPTSYGALEYSLSSARAMGLTYLDASLDLRVEFDVLDIFSGYFRLGAQAVRYQRQTDTYTESDFNTTFGSHFGFGSYIQMAGPYWGRVDFKFGWGPGNTLGVTAGVLYRWGSESDDSTGNE